MGSGRRARVSGTTDGVITVSLKRKRDRRQALDAPQALGALVRTPGSNSQRTPIPLALWREVVGPRIAERARPQTLQDGTLTLAVATSVWATELSMLADTLQSRLAERGVPVARLRFVIRPFDPPRPAENRASRRLPPPKPVPEALVAALSEVDEPSLRSAIAAAIAAHESWRSHVGGEPRGTSKPPVAAGARPPSAQRRDALESLNPLEEEALRGPKGR
jgi:predicted nucleic acid-binding Zn ribbon protein